jgi:hypothetical protein
MSSKSPLKNGDIRGNQSHLSWRKKRAQKTVGNSELRDRGRIYSTPK